MSARYSSSDLTAGYRQGQRQKPNPDRSPAAASSLVTQGSAKGRNGKAEQHSACERGLLQCTTSKGPAAPGSRKKNRVMGKRNIIRATALFAFYDEVSH